MNSVTGRGCIIVCSAKKLDKGVSRMERAMQVWLSGDLGVSGETAWDVPAGPFRDGGVGQRGQCELCLMAMSVFQE